MTTPAPCCFLPLRQSISCPNTCEVKKGNSLSGKLKGCFQWMSTEGQNLEIQICFAWQIMQSCSSGILCEKLKCGKRYNASFFPIGKGGAGKPFSSQESHFPAESGCTKFHVSSSYSYWDMSVQNRAVDWHRDTTIPSAASLAEYKPDMDAYFLLSLSPPPCVILLCLLFPPLPGPTRFASICRQEVIFGNDGQALISTQWTITTTEREGGCGRCADDKTLN